MWTTCPRCRGKRFITIVESETVVYEDECTLCLGDGGIPVEWDEDDPSVIDDVDVHDED